MNLIKGGTLLFPISIEQLSIERAEFSIVAKHYLCSTESKKCRCTLGDAGDDGHVRAATPLKQPCKAIATIGVSAEGIDKNRDFLLWYSRNSAEVSEIGMVTEVIKMGGTRGCTWLYQQPYGHGQLLFQRSNRFG